MSAEPLTRWLHAWQAAPHDRGAADRLAREVYQQLREIARARLRRERAPPVSATELVHEAWLRLSPGEAPLRDRAQFFRLASTVMRNFLVDQARERLAQRNGGGHVQVTLALAEAGDGGQAWPDQRLLDLDRALAGLAGDHPRAAEAIALRLFAGLSLEEIAEVTGVALATVKRDIGFARAWLTDALNGTQGETA